MSNTEYRFRPNSINDIFWVGNLAGSERSIRMRVLYFQSLSKYFMIFLILLLRKKKIYLVVIVSILKNQ
jgi:hypothetical protein